LLDTREQPAQTEERAKHRLDQRARRKLETIGAATRALDTNVLAGVHLSEVGEYTIPLLENWRGRMKTCGEFATHRVCPDDNHHVVTVDCCHVPACPHEEARTAKRWTLRGEQIMKRLRSGLPWSAIRKSLLREGVKLPKTSKSNREPNADAIMTWKLVTVSTRKAASLVHDVDAQIRLRKAFVRFVSRRWGLPAAFGAVEVGAKGNAHLHMLVYSPFLPRAELQHWLQAHDCDVQGCKHKAGDRTCRGSWTVDVRACFDPREPLKYACSPDASNMDNEDFAEMRLLTYLILYRRHRIETYGLAKPGAWKNVDLVDVYLEHGFCPYCGQQMIIVEVGNLFSGRYQWARMNPPPRGSPG
jgi:hypothetical protein